MKQPNFAYRWTVIPLVSLYLGGVFFWLLASRRVRGPGFWKIARARLRRPYRGEVDTIVHDDGNCFVAKVPAGLLSDRDLGSSLVVLEDGKPLTLAHSTHAEIRARGGGRFSHWGDQLYFSTLDNSNPLENHRTYVVEERRVRAQRATARKDAS